MTDDIQSLRKQLADAEENLRLLRERKAKYVLETDIPLHLIKGERRLEVQIRDLRERLEVCQEPLTQLYEQLQGAAAHEEWAEVLAVGEHIRALEAGYRDVSELMERARERLQQPQRRPMPTWAWWVAAGGVALVLLLGLSLALGPRLFGTSPAPTEAPAARPTEVSSAVPTEAPTRQPTEVPTAAPTQAPTEPPAETPTEPPTEEPTEGPTPEPAVTWTRPADGMVMVYVPAGEFEMGSTEGDDNEQPVHAVALDGFWIDRTEVTNAQYRRCVEAGDCSPPGESGSSTRDSYYGDSTYDDYPVLYVTWYQAAHYCTWAGARQPTEAEWEYAARGPEGRRFPWGHYFDGTRLNYCDANCPEQWADEIVDDGYADTAPVGNYPGGASWCGALDMAGNVFEWVGDWYGDYPSGRQVSPTGPSSGEYRVLRGGSWDGDQLYARCASRTQLLPVLWHEIVGFRCARVSR